MRTFVLILALASAVFAVPATAQFTSPHELPGDLAASPAAGDQRHADIASGNNQSLVVYEDHRAALGDTIAYSSSGVAMLVAARLDAAGTLMDATPIMVRKGTNSPRDPKVAWNGSTYLVVWDEYVRHTYESDRAVFAARVDTAGHLLDDPPILLTDVAYVDESYPVVASDGANWAVAWSDLVGGADVIRGCVLDANGAAGPLTTMMTASIGFYFPVNFEMAWSNGRYLFVSQHMAPGSSFNDAMGQLFDAQLNPVGSEFDIAAGVGSSADPCVAGNGTDFCVAWRYGNQAIRATPVSSTGNILVPGGVDLMGPNPGYAAYQLPSVAWDGVDWSVTFGTGSGLSTAMNVAQLSTGGVLVGGAPLSISQGSAAMIRPASASVTGGVQLVWDDDRVNPNPIAGWAADRTDIFCARVSSGGVASAPVDLSLSPPAQLDPQVAGDEVHGYLAAFFSVTQSTQTVKVQRLGPAGIAIDPQPVALFTGPRTLHNLALAWNGANWMLVWEEFAIGSSTIRGLRVALDGTALDPAPVAIMPGSGATIAAMGGDYLVVATNEPVLHHRYVYTLRVRGSDGQFLDPAPVQRTNVGFDTQTAVAAFNTNWIVVWAHMVTHDAPVATLRYMLVSGTGTGSIADLAGAGNTGSNNEPVLATDGSQALLAWTSDGNVLGRRILFDGTRLDTDAGFVISNANNQQFAPSVAWNGNAFDVAFGDYRTHTNVLDIGIGDVYASRVDPAGTVLEPSGIPIANEFLTPEGRPSVAGGGGATVAAFTALRTESPFGNWRIATSARLPSVGTGFCYGDGTDTTCPCTNTGSAGRGCDNTAATGGAALASTGIASISADSLVLHSTFAVPFGPGLYYEGSSTAAPGPFGVPFGNGLRCAGGNTHRLEVRFADGAGAADSTVPLAAFGAAVAGNTYHYQLWYRDSGSVGACTPGAGFNLSNALSVAWTL